MRDSLGVYISVPFCRAKCTYCNFASGVFGAERMDAYVERVCGEIRGVRGFWEGSGGDGRVKVSNPTITSPDGSVIMGHPGVPGRVDTVFFGGGTPSLLSAGQMRRLFAALRGEFEVVEGA